MINIFKGSFVDPSSINALKKGDGSSISLEKGSFNSIKFGGEGIERKSLQKGYEEGVSFDQV
jgi:hypothetical protein